VRTDCASFAFLRAEVSFRVADRHTEHSVPGAMTLRWRESILNWFPDIWTFCQCTGKYFRVIMSDIDARAIRGGGEAKTKNGMGVVEGPDRAKCAKGVNNQGCRTMSVEIRNLLVIVLALTAAPLAVRGATDDDKASEAELAEKLNNPVANLVSVPLQNNWDFGIGPADAMRYTGNIQPVIPVSLTSNFNLIIRTIVPVIYAAAPIAGGRDVSGLGDAVQSFFLSPKDPVGGWILGGGPVFLWPTASDKALGSGQWGAGPTIVALRQKSGWTYGALANHIWSYSGWGLQSVSATFIQPFVSFTTKTFTTFGLNTESTYDWNHSQWTVPFNASVSQLLKLGKQPIQFSLGARYYAENPSGGPNWGLRFTITLLFPK
jgi:hypothetical protein